jgi:hypothetical protein
MAKKPPLKFTANCLSIWILGDGFQGRGESSPGICEQYVDTAELFGAVPDDAFNLVGLADVTAQHGYVVPELTRRRLQSRRILPDDYDGRTFVPKQLCSFKSDAGSFARNEDNFVRQSHELRTGPIPSARS